MQIVSLVPRISHLELQLCKLSPLSLEFSTLSCPCANCLPCPKNFHFELPVCKLSPLRMSQQDRTSDPNTFSTAQPTTPSHATLNGCGVGLGGGVEAKNKKEWKTVSACSWTASKLVVVGTPRETVPTYLFVIIIHGDCNHIRVLGVSLCADHVTGKNSNRR